MYNLKLDGFWYHLRGNKKTGEIFNCSLKSNRNANSESRGINVYNTSADKIAWHHASFSFFSTKCHFPWQSWQNSKFLIKLFHSVTVLTPRLGGLWFSVKANHIFPLKSSVPTPIKRLGRPEHEIKWRLRSLKNNEFFWILSFFRSTVSNLFFHCVGMSEKTGHVLKQPKLGLPVHDTGVLSENHFRYPIYWDRCSRNMAHAKIYLDIFPFLLAANHSTVAQLAKQSFNIRTTNSRLSWLGVFALRNWKLITPRSSIVYNGNHFIH